MGASPEDVRSMAEDEDESSLFEEPENQPILNSETCQVNWRTSDEDSSSWLFLKQIL